MKLTRAEKKAIHKVIGTLKGAYRNPLLYEGLGEEAYLGWFPYTCIPMRTIGLENEYRESMGIESCGIFAQLAKLGHRNLTPDGMLEVRIMMLYLFLEMNE